MENFDELALTWDNEPRRLERANTIGNEIIKAIPDLDNMNALEYGCGTGLLSFYLQPYLKSVTLCDNSQGMLNVLSEKIKAAGINNMMPKLMDLTEVTDINDKYDIIYTLLALHHIDNIDMVINAFYRMLNQSGYICIADLDEEDGSFHGDEYVPHNGFNQKYLKEKLERKGFVNINSSVCYMNKKKLKDGTEREYPIFLMTAKNLSAKEGYKISET
ncbi:MAG: class I SAM-dependent methyltransferase [Bacillota bacterium]